MAFLYVVQAGLWRAIVAGLGERMPAAPARSVWAKSLLARYVPTSVLLIVGRVVLAERLGVTRRVTLASILYEAGLAICAAVIVGSYFVIDFPDLDHTPARFAVLLAIPAALAMLHPRVFEPLTRWGLAKLGREPLPRVLPFLSVLVLTLGYAIGWISMGLGVYCFTAALHPVESSDLPYLVASYPVAFCVAVLTFIVPSGLGTRDAALFSALDVVLPTAGGERHRRCVPHLPGARGVVVRRCGRATGPRGSGTAANLAEATVVNVRTTIYRAGMAGVAACAGLCLAIPATAGAASRPKVSATVSACGGESMTVAATADPAGARSVRGTKLMLRFQALPLFHDPQNGAWLDLGKAKKTNRSQSFSGLAADLWVGAVRWRFVRGRKTVASGIARSATGRAGGKRGRAGCVLPIGLRPKDLLAPFVTLTPNDSAWHRAPLDVRFDAADDLSGVAEVLSRVDGGPVVSGRTVTIASEGAHTVEYSARDVAGNRSPTQSATVGWTAGRRARP